MSASNLRVYPTPPPNDGQTGCQEFPQRPPYSVSHTEVRHFAAERQKIGKLMGGIINLTFFVNIYGAS